MMTAQDLLAPTQNDLILESREPLPVSSLLYLSARSHLSIDELLQAMGLSASILVQEDDLLTPDESDQLRALAELIVLVIDLFNNNEKAVAWLREPNQALSGDTPLSRVCTSDGMEQVKDLMCRIQYGMFS